MADLILEKNGVPKFSWGSVNLIHEGIDRDNYIAALKKMDVDRDQFHDLLSFARS
jgi:hypothetical protein